MGILKKVGKILGGVAAAGMQVPGTGFSPAHAAFGSLAEHLGEENKRHGHVKEVHHHYHKKKK